MNHLFIKNMVCGRCVSRVEELLQEAGIDFAKVELGKVYDAKFDEKALNELRRLLEKEGFELLESRERILIEHIKTAIIDQICNDKIPDLKVNWSAYLQSVVHRDYKYLSHVFSQTEGITIERFIILQKIERAKELLFYDELTVGEIAFRLGYSSSQYLSNQFKSITGQTPSQYKAAREGRKSLDKLY